MACWMSGLTRRCSGTATALSTDSWRSGRAALRSRRSPVAANAKVSPPDLSFLAPSSPPIPTPALDRHDTAAVWNLRLHGESGGPTSITGTARFVLTISYIDITPLSGHTHPYNPAHVRHDWDIHPTEPSYPPERLESIQRVNCSANCMYSGVSTSSQPVAIKSASVCDA